MFNQICSLLKNGGIVVMRTDTIYGLLASALDKTAVERVYDVKKRASDKQCIILISDPNSVPTHNELIKFYTDANDKPTSIIVPVKDEPSWITRGGKDVAYRLIRSGQLKDIIDTVGPLIAPSANLEGQPPAKNIDEAKSYFGDAVDLYVDSGEVPTTAQPSRLIRVNLDGSVEQLR